jgi:ribose 5-phosphate isomerase B
MSIQLPLDLPQILFMISENEVRQLVKQSVERILGTPPRPSVEPTAKPTVSTTAMQPSVTLHIRHACLIYQDDVRAVAEGGTLHIAPNTKLTPLARELALQRKIKVVTTHSAQPTAHKPIAPLIAIGADHGGYPLKENLKNYLTELGYKAIDVGTNNTEAVDYPDFAYSVAKLIADGQAWRGIMVDGAGIGSCMTANKVPGVRASMCYDVSSAINAREHNDANVLTLGGTLIGANLARQIVKTWLTTEFGGGRHARRVNKIMEVEQRFVKK